MKKEIIAALLFYLLYLPTSLLLLGIVDIKLYLFGFSCIVGWNKARYGWVRALLFTVMVVLQYVLTAYWIVTGAELNLSDRFSEIVLSSGKLVAVILAGYFVSRVLYKMLDRHRSGSTVNSEAGIEDTTQKKR